MSNLDRAREMAKKAETATTMKKFSSTKNIYHKWNTGDNHVRFVGNFVEFRTHYIQSSGRKGDRGLCRPEAFVGDGKLMGTVNCLDWDVEKECFKDVKTCPICALERIAKSALKDNPADAEKKTLETLRAATYPRFALKWNIIDRKDPYIVKVDNGKETKALGLKISTVSKELWNGINGILDQCECDIADIETGIDINVNKVDSPKTSYKATADLVKGSLKVTPLTNEERELAQYDLRLICGRQVEASKLLDALHGDYRQLIDNNTDFLGVKKETVKKEAPLAKSESFSDPLSDEDDDDQLLGAEAKKK